MIEDQRFKYLTCPSNLPRCLDTVHNEEGKSTDPPARAVSYLAPRVRSYLGRQVGRQASWQRFCLEPSLRGR